MGDGLKVYTVIDVARIMKVDQGLARSWFRTGKLKGVRFGGRAGWRCTEQQLREFMEKPVQPKLTGFDNDATNDGDK